MKSVYLLLINYYHKSYIIIQLPCQQAETDLHLPLHFLSLLMDGPKLLFLPHFLLSKGFLHPLLYLFSCFHSSHSPQYDYQPLILLLPFEGFLAHGCWRLSRHWHWLPRRLSLSTNSCRHGQHLLNNQCNKWNNYNYMQLNLFSRYLSIRKHSANITLVDTSLIIIWSLVRLFTLRSLVACEKALI